MAVTHQLARNLGAALDALDPRSRLDLAKLTLTAGDEPQAQALWRTIHTLTEGATPERLDHLVSVLEVVGPDVRAAVSAVADRAAARLTSLRPAWRALRDLARMVSTVETEHAGGDRQ